jgi:hypothetical protein
VVVRRVKYIGHNIAAQVLSLCTPIVRVHIGRPPVLNYGLKTAVVGLRLEDMGLY